ncbi:hypothetical protein [Amycolatopsis taiwanensis]|uniref:Uncharacterized protein n=1 Tax=Amycolatopsis taiwanensis TaxID=342230 RepID=A0A9W6VIR8_9PSEU|nr:hypothetical protein [Amycolatopsis taiwanensis]GLY68739.1 hypothetical protein Atai01_53580 [Amycolatopsis taiwanensis]
MNYHPNAINTVGELISALQRYDADTPVRWAHQPSWPMEYTIGQVVCTPDDADNGGHPPIGQPVVWLGQGRRVGYLPGIAGDALGWSDW